jgi:hypothetical protein
MTCIFLEEYNGFGTGYRCELDGAPNPNCDQCDHYVSVSEDEQCQ